jgi:hypothetical protein
VKCAPHTLGFRECIRRPGHVPEGWPACQHAGAPEEVLRPGVLEPVRRSFAGSTLALPIRYALVLASPSGFDNGFDNNQSNTDQNQVDKNRPKGPVWASHRTRPLRKPGEVREPPRQIGGPPYLF